MTTTQKHPIKVVSRRTGLTPHAIRIWEKRYGAVTPERTPTNRRLYSEADIERFRLLRKATEAGRSIGQIAHLSSDELRALVSADTAETNQPTQGPQTNGSPAQLHLEACLRAVERLDGEALEDALLHAAAALGKLALIEQIIVPLMHQIGELWREGALRVVHEHLASTAVRGFLSSLRTMRATSAHAAPLPQLIVTTPAGQSHELGALVVAATAAIEGWGVTYLGANLPAEEIAAAAEQLQAKAIALSITYPPDDPHLESELHRLRRSVPERVTVLVGGRSSDAYSEALRAMGAVRLHDMGSLRTVLEALRVEH